MFSIERAATAAPQARRSLCAGSFVARTIAGAVLAAGVLMASAPASADTLLQTSFAQGSQNFTITRPTNVSQGVSAGGFTGFYNGSPLLSYCIELVQTFSFGATYTDYSKVPVATAPNSGAMGQAKADAIARMFGANGANFYDSFTSTNKSVAMQLAIWEVVYENTAAFNLLNGGFQVTDGLTITVSDLAADYLALAAGNGPLAQIVALTSVAGSQQNGNQDFITVVPVPPSAALLATGLLFGLWTARRRRDVA